MEHDKKKNNYWLRIPQLLWFMPICYHLCIWPCNLPDVRGSIEITVMTIIGLLCVIFFENAIGKITAWICVWGWLSIILLFVYARLQSEFSIIPHMIPSFQMTVLLMLLLMLFVPLSLIFHQRILNCQNGKTLSIAFIVLVISCSLYSAIWTYEMQDKLAYEEYKKCKKLIVQIEDYKQVHGKYPFELSKVIAEGCFIYELSPDSCQYRIESIFEHWHDRCYVDYCTYSVESITYDSGTHSWRHDRP